MNLIIYKNIFLDRDGVINSIVIRDVFISSPRSIEEFKLRDDFIKFANSIKDKDFLIFVCTNQPDIKRNLLDLKELQKMHTLISNYIDLTEIIFCPHDDSDNCLCRKPLPGMLNSMILKYNLKEKSAYLLEILIKIFYGNNTNIETCLLKTSYNNQIKCSNSIHKLTDLNIRWYTMENFSSKFLNETSKIANMLDDKVLENMAQELSNLRIEMEDFSL